MGASLDAILPLKVDGSYGLDDLHRTDVLMASLSAFFEPELLRTFLVVSPAQEVSAVRAYLSQWRSIPVEVMAEEDLVPELCRYPKLRGWRKQQLVKLAASRVLTSDYCLTFDADVFSTCPTSRADLLPGDKALLQYESRSLHPRWWASSACLLGVDQSVGDPRRGMAITPAILAREVLTSLTKALTTERYSWAERLCRLHLPWSPSNWTPARFRRARWTEYSLYYLHAAAMGAIDDFYIEGGTHQLPQVLLGHEAHPFEDWEPAYTFSAENPALFCLVGSKSGLSPQVVWDAVKAYIPGQGVRHG
ncbi:MAG: hypothetical protein CME58_00950 [Halieaceae bacterium]|nr:hypothetical protein [Halieaceae bacterium]